MTLKRTLARISERFMWNGMVKDVKDMVSTLRLYMSHFNIVKKLFVHITYASIILLQISHCDTCQKMNRKMKTTSPLYCFISTTYLTCLSAQSMLGLTVLSSLVGWLVEFPTSSSSLLPRDGITSRVLITLPIVLHEECFPPSFSTMSYGGMVPAGSTTTLLNGPSVSLHLLLSQRTKKGNYPYTQSQMNHHAY